MNVETAAPENRGASASILKKVKVSFNIATGTKFLPAIS